MLVSRVVMPRIAPLRTLDLGRAPGRGGYRPPGARIRIALAPTLDAADLRRVYAK
jgi:hypothetical protein